jgi:hypothetical protein
MPSLKPRRRAVFVYFAVTLCALLLSSGQDSHAATSYVLNPNEADVGTVCASMGGSFSAPDTCVLASDLTLGSGDSLTVDPGAVLVVAAGVTLTNEGVVEDYGTMDNDHGGFLANRGTITAFIGNGTIYNGGSMTNYPTGNITVEHSSQLPVHVGSFNFTNSGVFSNGGVVLSYGNLTNTVAGSFTNSGNLTLASATFNTGKFSAPLTENKGNLTNTAGGVVTDDGGTLNSTGTITNLGTVAEGQNVFSVINNGGTFANKGALTDVSYVSNNGTLSNSGTLSIAIGCPLASCGTLSNDGLLLNTPTGTIDNQGNLGNANLNPRRPQLGNFTNAGTTLNSGVFFNDVLGTALNIGSFDNLGTVTNMGSLDNFGSINNSLSIISSGYIDNNEGASITNWRTISNSGSITNSGTITNACGGVIDGAGTLSGSVAVTSCSTTSTTSTPAPQFPNWAVAPLFASALVAALTAHRLRGRGARAPGQKQSRSSRRG